MLTSDKATKQDAIGFRLHAEVAAKVLWKQEQEDGKERAKIVAAVEGDWGLGKSSYMRMMRHWLRKQSLRTVWVSVWHHKEDGTLWAETTRDILAQLRRNSNLWQASKAFFRRLGSLLVQYLEALGRALPAILLMVVLGLFLFWVVPESWWNWSKNQLSKLPLTEGAVSISMISLLLLAWKFISDLYNHPLIKALCSVYQKRAGLDSSPTLSTFRHRLRQALQPYASRKKPVFVFIDDLDRIAPSEAAEVLWALSQLFDERLPAVFIVGIDRDKVAAGLASKHDQVMPYMYATLADRGLEGKNDKSAQAISSERRAVRFGYEFLEKVFNIRTEVPRLHPKRQQNFVGVMIGRLSGLDPLNSFAELPNFGANEELPDAHNAVDLLKSHAFINALKNNPRRIKQVSNELRLWWAQLNAYKARGCDTHTVTVWRLTKVVLLRLQWPVLYADLERHPKILAPLALAAEYALEEEPPIDWLSDAEKNCYRRCKDRLDDDLISVLAHGTSRNLATKISDLNTLEENLSDRSPDAYSLAALDFDSLLRVPHSDSAEGKTEAVAESPGQEAEPPEQCLETSDFVMKLEVERASNSDAIKAGDEVAHFVAGERKTSASQPDLTGKSDSTRALICHDPPSKQEVRRLKRQLARIARSAGKDTIEFADALQHLGDAYREDGSPHEARNSLEESAALYYKLVGEQDPYYGSAINSLGMVAEGLGRLKEATEHHEKALEIYKTAFGDRHPIVATVLHNLGRVQHRQCHFERAIVTYREALDIYQATLGHQHPNVANTLNSLGRVRLDQGLFSDAVRFLRRALDIDKAAYGDQHPNVATRLNNLGSALKDQGHLDAAVKCFEKSLEIYRAAFGDRHPYVATTLNNLGRVCKDQGRVSEAMEIFEQVLKIYRTAYGNRHPNVATTLIDIGSLLHGQTNVSKATKTFEQAISIFEASYGNEHPYLGISETYLGYVLIDKEDWENSRELLERGRSNLENAYGADHWRVAQTDGWLGVLDWASGDSSNKPISACADALTRLLKVFGPLNRAYVVTLSHKLREMGDDPVEVCREALDANQAEKLQKLLEDQEGG